MGILKFLVLFTLFASAKPPNWLKTKPSDPTSYIGIAKVSKGNRDDYKQRAINTALSFISSEISVMVKSTTENIVKDINGIVDDTFESETTTLANEKLEGYEIVDTWENKKEFAVYCKLSKQKYLDSKRAKFLGSLELIRNAYETYQEVLKNRDFGRALALSADINRDSKNMLRGGGVLPFMTSFEIEEMATYINLFENLVANTAIVIKDEGIAPFSWCGPEQIKILLVDNTQKAWNSWEGTVYNANDTELYTFQKQHNEIVDFPLTVYIGSLGDLRFKIALTLKRGKEYEEIRKIDFSIPVNKAVVSGKISVKGIPKTMKSEIDALVERLFVDLKHPTGGDTETDVVDINLEYFRSFSSPKWEKGVLSLSLKNVSAGNIRSVGVGKMEASCSGNTLEQAVNNGLKILQDNFSGNGLKKWK